MAQTDLHDATFSVPEARVTRASGGFLDLGRQGEALKAMMAGGTLRPRRYARKSGAGSGS